MGAVFTNVWAIDEEGEGDLGELVYLYVGGSTRMSAPEMCMWGNEGVSKRRGIYDNLEKWGRGQKRQYRYSRDMEKRGGGGPSRSALGISVRMAHGRNGEDSPQSLIEGRMRYEWAESNAR